MANTEWRLAFLLPCQRVADKPHSMGDTPGRENWTLAPVQPDCRTVSKLESVTLGPLTAAVLVNCDVAVDVSRPADDTERHVKLPSGSAKSAAPQYTNRPGKKQGFGNVERRQH